MYEEILYVSDYHDLDDILELDLEAFQKLYRSTFKKEAKQVINQFSTSALAFAGKKKTVQEFLKPYIDAISPDQPQEGGNDAEALMKAMGGGNSF